MVTDVAGDHGELVDRLIKVCSDGNDTWAYNNLGMLAMNVGLQPPHMPWHQDQYAEQVRQHLMRFVKLGLREEVLVRGLHTALDTYWTTRADVGAADQKTAQLRETTEHIRDNPVDYVGVGQFGDSVEEVVSKAEAVLAYMNESPVFRPVDADSASERWAETDQWRRLTVRYLSDDTIRVWREKRLRKHMR